MAKEYKIVCPRLSDGALDAFLKRLPSPIHRQPLSEIYNFRITDDYMYFIDQEVDAKVASQAFMMFLDAALASTGTVTVVKVKKGPARRVNE